MARKKDFDDIIVLHDYGLDITNRTIYISTEEINDGEESGVDAKLAERVIKNLRLLDSQAKEGDKPITLILSGNGGDWYSACAIYDAISLCKNEVIAIAYGSIMSAHSIIFQAADQRVMTKFATQMIHFGYFGAENHTKVFKSWAKESERIDGIMEDIYLNRIQEKKPDFKRKDLQKMLMVDSILDSAQSVEFGLADSILE